MRNEFYASDQSFWKAAILLGVLLLLGGRYGLQLYLDHKLDLAQAQWEVEIEKARSVAQAAQLRLISLTNRPHVRQDEAKAKEVELIRAEARNSHLRYQEILAQAMHEKEMAEQQARRESERQQHDGATESRNQIAALRRALDIPIQRH
ncbi:hypothetical protein [Noviherbaspirillum autotrophicum]|uniref:Uncharacterized protein n=1 Tax=Noviherbaspirillum autotrophicum TaxID=709839 RepID=A0A0C2BIR6_9BURK|nr:hypothetical protein [Noviherbaspirillum autotrophicum]KIF81135.1 hypothetical protein TSA66_10460 [Noviherbaspirillum autotrophicum]